MKKPERPAASFHEMSPSLSRQEYEPIMASADLREGWDLESWSEEFVKWARQQPWYRSDLLYSGFDAEDIGSKEASTWLGGLVWASSEIEMLGDDRSANPMDYAQEYSKPAIAVYDPAKMQEQSIRAYKPVDASARIVIVKLVLE